MPLKSVVAAVLLTLCLCSHTYSRRRSHTCSLTNSPTHPPTHPLAHSHSHVVHMMRRWLQAVGTYWRLDLDMQCYTGQHLAIAWAVGLPGLLLFVAGVPASAALWIWACRRYVRAAAAAVAAAAAAPVSGGKHQGSPQDVATSAATTVAVATPARSRVLVILVDPDSVDPNSVGPVSMGSTETSTLDRYTG